VLWRGLGRRLQGGGPMVQFIKFAVVGVLNSAIQYLVFLFLYSFTGTQYLLASIIGYVAGMTNSYILNRRWTFESRNQKLLTELGRFVAVNLVSLGVNLGLLYLLVSTRLMIPQWAQVVAITGSTLVNFVLNKVWTFAP
jgi:putative flippase GtrA